MSDDEPFTITAGATAFECNHGQFKTSINDLDFACGVVTADDLGRSPADWAGPAVVAIGNHTVTEGGITEASPEADAVTLTVRSGLALTEGLMAPMVSQNITPSEIVHAGARSAGFAEENLHIGGLEQVPTEPLWVLAPVEGLQIEQAVRMGVVEFIDAADGLSLLQRFSPPLDPEFSEPLQAARAFARVAVVAKLPYHAEQEGLALIDTATAWLTTRLRYSWSHNPDGTLATYERAPTRVIVQRQDGVGVLAVEGARRWWRQTSVGRGDSTVSLEPQARWTSPAMPANIPAGDRQALFALQRAITEPDPVQRVAALWEAIEFYVGKGRPPRLFARDEVETVIAQATVGLNDNTQAARVEEVLRNFLNQAPIMERLKHVLDTDDVPITEDDLALLGRLREARNSAAHGSTTALHHDDVDRGVAMMSRAITTRWHRSNEGSPARDPRAQ